MTAQTATIQVQYVNPPKEEGWKSGSIKDSNGQLFSVLKEHLGYFQKGETCDVIWEQTGKYPAIIGKGGQLFPSGQLTPQPGSAVQPQTAAQVWKEPLAPKPPQNVPETPTPPILSNVLASAINAGAIKGPEDLTAWAFHVRQAVDNFHNPRSPGGQARNPQGDNGPELSDEIPF